MKASGRIMKRCIAMALSFAMLVSSNSMGFLFHAHAVEEKKPTVSLGEILAGNYELSDVEEQILKSGKLAADVTFTYTLPPEVVDDDDKLVAVNQQEKKITVEKYKDEAGNMWIPATVWLKVNETTVETIQLSANGKSYEGAYTYSGGAFAVVVQYKLTGGSLRESIQNVQQLALLNAAVHMAEDVDFMQKLDKDAFATMSNIPLTPNSFLDTMTVQNPLLGDTPVNLLYSLVEGFTKSVQLPGDAEATTISIKLTGDAEAAAKSLKQQQEKNGRLDLPNFLATHPNSYLELLYNGDLKAGLHAALDQNIADINGLLAEGGIGDVADQIEQVQKVTLPDLEKRIYSLINGQMATITAVLGQIAGVEGDVNTLAEVEAIQSAVVAFYQGKLADANNKITDEITSGNLKQEWVPQGGIQSAADLKTLMDNVQAEYDAGVAKINTMLESYNKQYGISFPKVNSSADIDGVKTALSNFISGKISTLNLMVKSYNKGYGLTLPTVPYTGLDGLDKTAEGVQALRNELAAAKVKLAAVFTALNAELRSYGYTGAAVTSAAQIDTVILPWLQSRITEQNTIRTNALAAAKAILEGTKYSGTIASVADIESAIAWLTGNAGDELVAAQAVVTEKVNIAKQLAKGFGYPDWDKIATSADVDLVSEWLDAQIAADEANYNTYLTVAQGQLDDVNKKLPEAQRYNGTIASSADVGSVIAWMDASVKQAEDAYNNALTTVNKTLQTYGYTGAEVAKPSDLTEVVKPDLESKKAVLVANKANIDGQITSNLDSLNATLKLYGYQQTVKTSADIDAAVDYMNTKAEKYICGQINSKIPATVAPLLGKVENASHLAGLKLNMDRAHDKGLVDDTTYQNISDAISMASAAISNIPTIVQTLTEAKATLARAEAVSAQMGQAIAQIDIAIAQLPVIQSNLQTIKDVSDTAKAMSTQYRGTLVAAKAALAAMEGKIAVAKAALPEKKQKLAEAKKEITDAEDALSKVDDPTATVIPALNAEKSKIVAAEAEIKTIESQQAKMQTWKENLTKTENAVAGIESAETQLDTLYTLLTDETNGIPVTLKLLDEAKGVMAQAEAALELLNGYYQQMLDAEAKMELLDTAVEGLKELETYKAMLDQYAGYLPTLIGILEKFGAAVKPVADRFDNEQWQTDSKLLKANTNFQTMTGWAESVAELGLDLYTEQDLIAADDLLVKTANTQYNMSMYTVTVTYTAEIVNPQLVDSAETIELTKKVVKRTFEAGTTREQLAQAILAEGLEEDALKTWKNYNISEENYTRVASQLPTVLDADFSYTVSYTPKNLNVSYEGGMTGPATVPYGYRMSLPVCQTEKKEYQYNINGVDYGEGGIIVLTKDTQIVRSLHDASTEKSLLELVVNATNISAEAKQILASDALSYGGKVKIRFPSNSLVSVDAAKGTLNAESYAKAIGNKGWNPISAITKDLSGKQLEALNAFTGNKAPYTKDFAVAEVLYQIAFTADDLLDVSEKQILDAMNLANVLVDEYSAQKATLDYLSSDRFLAALEMLDANNKNPNVLSYLKTAQTSMATDPAKPALDTIVNALESSPTGKLPLYNELANYSSQGMAYYYKNAETICHELNTMQGAMATLTGSQSFMGIVSGVSKDLHDRLVGIKDELLSVEIAPRNACIRTDNDIALKQLVAELDAYAKVNKTTYTSVGTMTWSTTLSATVGVKIVTVNVGWGAKAATLKINFTEGEALTAEDIANLMTKLAELEAEMGIDKVHYASTGSLPKVGDVMGKDLTDEDLTYNITWEPKSYDIYAGSKLLGSVTYENPFFVLPVHSNADYRYTYIIGSGNDAMYPVQGQTLDFSANFDKLFANGSLSIVQKEIDKIHEKMLNFANTTEGALTLVEHGNRQYSLVMNIDPTTMQADLGNFVMGLLMSGYDYIGMDGQMFFGKPSDAVAKRAKAANPAEDEVAQFHLQAVVDMIMNSGMGTQSIVDMYGANGINNIALKGQIVSADGGNIKALGGKLLQSTMSFGDNAQNAVEVDFYLTMSNSEAVRKLSKALSAVESYITVAFQNGQLEALVNLPEPVYAAYLAALTMTGETELQTLDQINAEIALGYLISLIDPIFGEENVTIDTFANSIGMITSKPDLSQYAGYFDMIKRMVNTLAAHRSYTQAGCLYTFNDISINRAIDWAQQNVIAKLANRFGAGADDIDLSALIYEYKPAGADQTRDDYGLDVKVYAELSNLNTKYAAMFVDIHGNGLSNKAGLLTAQEVESGALANINGPAVVILLSDINGNVKLNGATFLDLNGKTIHGDLAASATTIITDNYYRAAEPGGVTGTVSGNVTIIDGIYGSDVSAFLLDGYEQLGTGAVSNKLYTITCDSVNNITVTLHTNASSIKELASVKSAGSLGMDIALDLLLNHYNMAALSIGPDDGELCKIIDIRFDDILKLIAGENRVTNGINTVLNHTSLSDLADLFNAVTDDLTDFGALEKALSTDGVIATYRTETAAWQLGLQYIEEGDYMSAVFGSSDNRKPGSLTIAIDGGLTDDLVTLLGALAETVHIDSQLDFDDLQIDKNGLLDLVGSYKGVVDIDFTVNRNYVIMMAVIIAHGNPSVRDEMVNAIKTYYNSNETSMADLEDCFKALSADDLTDALANVQRNESFDMMVRDLKLNGIVDSEIGNDMMGYGKVIDILGIGLRLLKERNLLESILGSGRTLGSFEKTDALGSYFGFSTNAASENYRDLFAGYSVGYSLALKELSLKLRLFAEEDRVIVTNASGIKIGAFDNLAEAFKLAQQNAGCTISVTGGITADEDVEIVNTVKLVGARRITFTNGAKIILKTANAKLISDEKIDANVAVADETAFCLAVTEEAGNTVYTAANHSLVGDNWQWNADENAATAKVTFTCANCGCTKTVDAMVTVTDSKDADCDNEGYITYTATATYQTATATDTYTVTVAAGHKWGQFTKVSDATCTEPAIYECVCDRCGEITKKSEGSALGHLGEYEFDPYGHWFVCDRNCGHKVDNTAHTGLEDGKCDVCAYSFGLQVSYNNVAFETYPQKMQELFGNLDGLKAAFDAFIEAEDAQRDLLDAVIYDVNMYLTKMVAVGENNWNEVLTDVPAVPGLHYSTDTEYLVEIPVPAQIANQLDKYAVNVHHMHGNTVGEGVNAAYVYSIENCQITIQNGTISFTLNEFSPVYISWTCKTNHAEATRVGYRGATCTMPGYTGDLVCDNCGETVAYGTAIPATGHVDANNDHFCDKCGGMASVCTDSDQDGKCDICGADMNPVCQHADTDGDHACDNCGTVISLCADNDNDHLCDICGTAISLCADTNGDHNCDLCGKTISLCADADSDHLCDQCGIAISLCSDSNDADHNCDLCGKLIENCYDTNSDHFCDECGIRISQCSDSDDADHNCDVCGEKIENCYNGNADHLCDECNAVVSLCEDTEGDGDHNCDLCGKKIGLCEDTDDHLCDECDAVISLCSDADGDGDHNCDLCGKKIGLCEDTDDHLCDECGKVISICSDVAGDGDHNCDLCGEKIGMCEDTDDHLCDECGERLSNCSDATGDGDHNCDLCGEQIENCFNNNGDHNCDECDAVITLCVDNDGDHLCDVCGKQISLCQHTDIDSDHICDECNVVISLCSDATGDGDHNCDICGEKIGLCADTDDHKCDECGTVISLCADAAGDGDHNCDLCGKEISLCEDTDDHLCDECGERLSNCSDATGDGDHKCDLCGKIASNCTDADDHFCDECGKVISVCTDAVADGNHNCDICGAANITACHDVDGDNDHKCDDCGQDHITACRDAANDGDHSCDECGAASITACRDAANDGDHSCDECGAANITACFDANRDHKCDECDTVMGVCVDSSDADHNCDICGTLIESCYDYSRDHHCDECGKEISLCADNDSDHKCDACGKTISLCADADGDGDHLCDICGKAITLCADTDDHLCDECGTVVSLCVDNNGDHKCDLCGAVISLCQHTDANNDHICDDCAVTISPCADATGDGDHNCDICGDKIANCFNNNGDHICDECGAAVSLCVDANGDRKCDICGAVISLCQHADTNNDHICDACGEVISLCEDTDGDHKCDTCGTVISLCQHADANNDHNCDKCGAAVSLCVDANGDRKCDICGAVISLCQHADTNNDHICDACGEVISLCEDTDGDHKCDTCGTVISLCQHADANNDHNCDKCGEVLGLCADAANDGDHKCDLCGKPIELCADADGDGDHKCDECHAVLSMCKDADNDHICDECGRTTSRCADATGDGDHDCDICGEKNINSCQDADNDGNHTCDECGKVNITACQDADNDGNHACDECGKANITACQDADNDGNHTCDECGKANITACHDAGKDGNHTCDECGKDNITACFDAANDGDHKCDDCAAVVTGCEDSNKDHTCDECGGKVGVHEDQNKDHNCDYGCSEKIGTHADSATDSDHVCDYGCGAVLESCVDQNKDHTCDNGCGKYFGTHADSVTDTDHVCDYGCGAVLELCADLDKDHDCDFGCDKYFGAHEDQDKDHICDYGCSEKIGTHADSATDSDHVCDYGCGAILESCKDTTDGNHSCDICGKADITGCADNNKDHKCDDCGKVLTVCVDADGNTVCDICGKDLSVTIGTPVVTVGNKIYSYQVDAVNKILYLDTIAEGVTMEALQELLSGTLLTGDADGKAVVTIVNKDNRALAAKDLVPTAAKLTLTAENEFDKETAVYSIVVIGDVNCNGSIDNNDAILMRLHYLGKKLQTGLALDAADTNRNGGLDNNDTVLNTVKYLRPASYTSKLKY